MQDVHKSRVYTHFYFVEIEIWIHKYRAHTLIQHYFYLYFVKTDIWIHKYKAHTHKFSIIYIFILYKLKFEFIFKNTSIHANASTYPNSTIFIFYFVQTDIRIHKTRAHTHKFNIIYIFILYKLKFESILNNTSIYASDRCHVRLDLFGRYWNFKQQVHSLNKRSNFL